MSEDFAWKQTKRARKTRIGSSGDYRGGEGLVWQPLNTSRGQLSGATAIPRAVGELLRDRFYACGFCKGEGMKPEGSKCPVCKGSGEIKIMNPPVVKCAYCNGRGEDKPRGLTTCSVCKGKGVVPVKEPVEVCGECNGRGRKIGGALYCGRCKGSGVIHVDKEERDPETGKATEKFTRKPSGTARDICLAIYQLGGEAGRAEIANRARIGGAYSEYVLKDMVGKGWLVRYGRDVYGLTRQTESCMKEMEEKDMDKITPEDIEVLRLVQKGAGEYKINDVARKLKMREVSRCSKLCTKLAKADFMDIGTSGRIAITHKGEQALKEGPKAPPKEEVASSRPVDEKDFFRLEL